MLNILITDILLSRKKQLYFVIIISIFILLYSCKAKTKSNSPCFQPYAINNLLKNYDSSKFVIRNVGEKIEIWDTLLNNKEKDGSFYVFDKHNNLEFYGFLEDSSGAYKFGVSFDSSGNEIKKTGTDVIRWYVQKKGDDSLKLSFLLFKLNRSYGNITLKGSEFSKHINLLVGNASNTIGAEIIIGKKQGEAVFISGIIRDDCSMKKRELKDSLEIP